MFSTVLTLFALFWFCFLCVYFGHTHLLISNFNFPVKVRVGWQIYVFKVKSCFGQLELLSNFQSFNFKKFVVNTRSL